jgi:hypothetical protein
MGLFCFFHLAAQVQAQPLPKVRLQPIFTAMTFDRPVWMCQAPGEKDRFFVVEETGRILILQKGKRRQSDKRVHEHQGQGDFCRGWG